MKYYIKVDGSLMSDTEAREILDEGAYKALQFFVENGSIKTVEYQDDIDDETYRRLLFATVAEMVDSHEETDDSDWEYEKSERRGCSDCPDDECTGHCMSCYYRPV